MADDAIKNVTVRDVVRPLVATFATSLGQKTRMHSIIVKVRLKNGAEGLGECPTSFVMPNENAQAIRGMIEASRPGLIGRSASEYAGIAIELRREYPQMPMTASGIETALWRAWLAFSGKDEWKWFGGASDTIETDITVPVTRDEAFICRWVGRAVRAGFTTYKIKVNGDAEKDRWLIGRVVTLLKHAGKGFSLRLDGNQAFSVRSCLGLCEHVNREGCPVELFEQPLKKDDLSGLKELTRSSPLPVILDETVFSRRHLETVINEGLGHGVNIKVAKSGISESLAIIDLAKKSRMKLMAGCMIETMTGLSAGILMAMGTHAFDYIDLDSVHYLHHKNRYGDIVIDGACYRRCAAMGS
jgi:L-alanine-DL-glutamate epimerase-like enolase superfamily enzyme